MPTFRDRWATWRAKRWVAKGRRAEQRGSAQEACRLYRKAVAAAPAYAGAHLNLGIALEAAGELEAAMAAHQAALDLEPNNPYASYNLGRLQFLGGAPGRAIELLSRALAQRPQFAEAAVVLANAYQAAGNSAAAAAVLEAALRTRPDYPLALRAYGSLLVGLERWPEAQSALRRFLALEPADAEAWIWLGHLLAREQRLPEAEPCYRKATQLDARLAEGWSSLGRCLTELGRREEALACLKRALDLRPDLADAHLGLGNVYVGMHQSARAEASYRRAIELNSRDVEAHMNLGNLLLAQGAVAPAQSCYHAALAAAPDYVEARWSLAFSVVPPLRSSSGQLRAARAQLESELGALEHWFDGERAENGFRAVGMHQPFWLAYQEEDHRELLERYGRLCARLMGRWQEREGLHPAKPRRPGAIRVGFVSQYFHNHSVWNVPMKGWFRHLSAERFALGVFSLSADHDDETRFARSRAARFVQAGRGLRQWVETIIDWQPDVLIYPEIGMNGMAAKLASLRLAPVQAASWGHPQTSGLPTIDYYMSGELLEPPGAAAHYSERLVALANFGCAVEGTSPGGAPQGAPVLTGREPPLLICPGMPFKYAPEHDGVLVEIARRLGRCTFVFFTHESTMPISQQLRARLSAAFARGGLDLERHAAFIPWQPATQFRQLLGDAHVYLDTIGFSGFNTALRAVECGLPIVTREGRFMRGRLASAILKRLGLHELVTASDEEYAALAVRLARESQYRAHLRERMKAHEHLLFDDLTAVRELEAFLAEAVERYQP